MLHTGMKALTVMVLLQVVAVGNSLIIRRPQAVKCEVEDDLSNEGCSLEMLPELELLAMMERRGMDGSEFRAVLSVFFSIIFCCSGGVVVGVSSIILLLALYWWSFIRDGTAVIASSMFLFCSFS